jgi:hypothetical protein
VAQDIVSWIGVTTPTTRRMPIAQLEQMVDQRTRAMPNWRYRIATLTRSLGTWGRIEG